MITSMIWNESRVVEGRLYPNSSLREDCPRQEPTGRKRETFDFGSLRVSLLEDQVSRDSSSAVADFASANYHDQSLMGPVFAAHILVPFRFHTDEM
jgi:hypothetical protein